MILMLVVGHAVRFYDFNFAPFTILKVSLLHFDWECGVSLKTPSTLSLFWFYWTSTNVDTRWSLLYFAVQLWWPSFTFHSLAISKLLLFVRWTKKLRLRNILRWWLPYLRYDLHFSHVHLLPALRMWCIYLIHLIMFHFFLENLLWRSLFQILSSR